MNMDRWGSAVQHVATGIFPPEMLSTPLVLALIWIGFGKIFLGLIWEAATKTQTARAHRIFRMAIPPGQRLREIKSSWHVVSDAVLLSALIRTGLIRLAPETLTGGLITFAIFYVWVEVWYYSTHRWMHESEILYRVHRSHHLTQLVTPLSSISMSWIEKWIFYSTGWLAFMAAISWVVPVTLSGITAYFTFHFVISLHGHSNVEASHLGSSLSHKLKSGSATSHALHHARFRVNYGFSSMVLDRLLGTYSAETEILQAKAVAKDGVESFKKTRSPASPT